MRLSEEQIKQGLVHTDQDVRHAAIRYFAQSFNSDPTVLPVAIEAIRRYGWDEAFFFTSEIERLAISDDTLDWVLGELRQPALPEVSPLGFHGGRATLIQMLVQADPVLLARHQHAILAVDALDADARRRIAAQIRFLSADPEALWQDLEEFSVREKDTVNIGDAGIDDAHAWIQAIARHGGRYADRILSLLREEVERVVGNPRAWMEGFAVRLAGEIRLEAAVPLIVAKLRQDQDDGGDWLSDTARRALVKIGTDSVVSAISADFAAASWGNQLDAAAIMEAIHSDHSAARCIELLEGEADPTIQAALGHAINCQFSAEGIEAVRQLVLRGTADGMYADLRAGLLAVAKLMRIEFPEMAEWRVEVERKWQEHKERITRLAQGARDEAPEAAELEQDSLDMNDLLKEYAESTRGTAGRSKVGRNDPCPCGSGKKFKKCCLNNAEGAALE